jgi:hypothetical protein
MLGTMDEGFDGRGFPVAEILAGFLRRLRREARACVLVLDDVNVGGPDLGPVLRALGAPDRFLPEGETGIPPVWTVLAGTPEALHRAESEVAGRWRVGPFVSLAPYDPHALRALVTDRAQRALGRPPPADLVDRLVETTITEGGSAFRVIELLRRALIGPAFRQTVVTGRPGRAGAAVSIEPRVVRAIEDAAQGSTARLGDVKRFEARYARSQGVAPLPPTTLWRRIVRLEQAGYVRREIRPGGVGGTRSLVRVIAPVDEWIIAPDPRENPRGSEPWVAMGVTGERESDGAFRPRSELPPADDEAD